MVLSSFSYTLQAPEKLLFEGVVRGFPFYLGCESWSQESVDYPMVKPHIPRSLVLSRWKCMTDTPAAY